jgi:hypothetical protein
VAVCDKIPVIADGNPADEYVFVEIVANVASEMPDVKFGVVPPPF